MRMKYIYIAGIVVGVLAFVGFVTMNGERCDAKSSTCNTVKSSQNEAGLQDIERDLRSGALLVDVREPDEFAEAHARGAVNLPLSQIQSGRLPAADKDAQIYVYCRSGKRAATAKILLENAGYKNITSLGGLSDWQRMGGELARGDPY